VLHADLRPAPAFRESAWDRFWFGESSLVRLGAFRIVMMLAALYAVVQHRDALLAPDWTGRPEFVQRAWHPILAFEILRFGPAQASVAGLLYAATVVSIALAGLGLFARLTCAIAAALTFLEIGTVYSLGQPHHDCIALVFGLFALPFGPVGARLSLDALIENRGRPGFRSEDSAPWAALPVRFTQVTAAIGYFFAGASKLAIGGTTWLNGYSLQAIMLHFHGDWTPFFAGSVFACQVMSLGLILVQATFPLALFLPRLRWFYVPAAIAFHLLTWKTMDTGPYLTLWFTLASFVPLEQVPAFVRGRIGAGPIASRIAWIAILAASAVLVASVYLPVFPSWGRLVLLGGAAAATAVGARRSRVQRPESGTR
jgi:hypothetical protein